LQVIYGVEKPVITKILIIRILLIPYTFGLYIYEKAFKKKTEDSEIDEEIRTKLGYSVEEWEEVKRKSMEKMENRMYSAKAKRYRRWMKSHDKVTATGEG